jgi:hypothetical protein
MDLRGQPESTAGGLSCRQDGVGVDGDFTRYQGSVHDVHDTSGHYPFWVLSIWVVPQVHFCSCPLL